MVTNRPSQSRPLPHGARKNFQISKTVLEYPNNKINDTLMSEIDQKICCISNINPTSQVGPYFNIKIYNKQNTIRSSTRSPIDNNDYIIID